MSEGKILEEQKENSVNAAANMAQISIAIADAFIICWDQKYKSNLTRPETIINKFADSDLPPILQTPVFPEHTSGHSVASTTAATLLTHMYGDQYTFVDSTEVPFGLAFLLLVSFSAMEKIKQEEMLKSN